MKQTAIILVCAIAVSLFLAHPAGAASFTPLGVMDGRTENAAYAVNADGSVVVGAGYNIDPISGTLKQDFLAYRWTAGGGLAVLSGAGQAQAYGVSADGGVVVGWHAGSAFRWTAGTGMTSLTPLAGGDGTAGAWAVSANGTVIGGASSSSGGWQATRWVGH